MKQKKNQRILWYLFFGVCTTLVNLVVYWLWRRFFHGSTVSATGAAWVVAVLFAFFTNKRYVFDSPSFQASVWMRELAAFLSCRIGTGLLDLALMYGSVELLGLPELWMKAASNGLVIILNYIASKMVIFRRKS